MKKIIMYAFICGASLVSWGCKAAESRMADEVLKIVGGLLEDNEMHQRLSKCTQPLGGVAEIDTHLKGMNALHIAALFHNPTVLDYLISTKQFDVNTKVQSGIHKGKSPLHLALSDLGSEADVGGPTSECVQALCRAGADTFSLDDLGRTPFVQYLIVEGDKKQKTADLVGLLCPRGQEKAALQFKRDDSHFGEISQSVVSDWVKENRPEAEKFLPKKPPFIKLSKATKLKGSGAMIALSLLYPKLESFIRFAIAKSNKLLAVKKAEGKIRKLSSEEEEALRKEIEAQCFVNRSPKLVNTLRLVLGASGAGLLLKTYRDE
jgi:hypothetical protein